MPTEISPWIERLRPHRLSIITGTLLVVLAVALAWVAWRWGVAEDRMAMLQAKADAGYLQAPSTSRTVRVDLRAPATVTLGGGEFPERVDFLLNARTARFARFRVSLVRDDGTLLFHADQVVRDSKFDLRLSVNTSILPVGGYAIDVKGYSRSGKMERFAVAKLRVVGR